ncbi:hypothetical protein BOX15_Mlig024885g1 [Macrostomum lignano]|uniref:Glycerol-3-phosphate dehydrogenase [NAD(+)] n=1 Tax=Macrostomum lignano TaxID=282301 RepID=A0A267EZ93_9PLAT|nr:hypothetical protein BOX15_Mlig024885g1 [Macrostomum lignano]
MEKHVAVVGSGNMGSCISKICALNARSSTEFCNEVRIWVHEELIGEEKLSDIINTRHENVKYLAGTRLPENAIAVTDLAELGSWADILIFVLPQQFLPRVLAGLKGHTRPGACAVSLIKGVFAGQEEEPMPRGLSLLTDLIRSNLGMECAVLMGANLAPEIAKEVYCEATLGCRDPIRAAELKRLFQTPYFRISIIENEFSVEICGALKSIVATGAGFCDALGFGDNTKAAVIRLGFMEILRYVQRFYGSAGVTKRTLMQSCGMGDIISSCYNTKDVKWAATHDGSGPLGMHDLVTTCYGGRNRKLGEAMVLTGKPLRQLEKEMLDGQRLQGPLIAAEVHRALQEEGQLQRFPLMVAVHLICSGQMKPQDFIEQLREHPEHM